MMKKLLVALGIAGLFGALVPLTMASAPISDATDPEITDAAEFDNLANNVNDHMDKKIKIAGQKIRVEETDEGLLVVAEFLPYPVDDLHFSDSADGKPKPKKGRGRFTFLYPGKKNVTDPILTWKGNKFILLGNVKGQKKVPITLSGKTISVPYIVANCVRVWKTGGSEIPNAPDTDFVAYPPLARTYCFD